MSGLSVGMKCLKCAVFFFNIICFLCAILLIGVGSYVHYVFAQYGSVLHAVWRAAPIVLIVLGVIILCVSFLGCCGALKENVCMLYMYGVLLIILLIGELAAAILAIVYKEKIDAEMKDTLTDAFKNYNSVPEVKDAIDLLQNSFKCCGASGSADWGDNVPPSCGSATEGCAGKFSQFLKENMVIIACVAFGVCFIQLLSIIIAFCLGNRIRGSYSSVNA